MVLPSELWDEAEPVRCLCRSTISTLVAEDEVEAVTGVVLSPGDAILAETKERFEYKRSEPILPP